MTITITPQTEFKLRARAEREGTDIAALADALLSRLLEEPVMVREKPLDRYIAEQREKRSLPASWPSPDAAVETEPGVFVAPAA